MNTTIGIQDKWVGLIVGIILLSVAQLGGLQFLERIIYDWQIRRTIQASNEVAVIAIDDKSLQELGDWPWSRAVYAQLLALLTPHSKAIGITLDFKNPQATILQTEAFPKQIQQLDAMVNNLRQLNPHSSQGSIYLNDFINQYEAVADTVQKTIADLNADRQLGHQLEVSDKIILGMFTKQGELSTDPLPPYLLDHTLKMVTGNPSQMSLFNTMIVPPTEALGNKASNIGAIVPKITESHRIPLVVDYHQHYFPTLPLLLVAKSHQLSHQDIEVILAKGIRAGYLRFDTDKQLAIQPIFPNNEAQSVTVDSLVDVLTGKVSPQKYQGKIVLLGVTASHYSILQSTPLGKKPLVMTLAYTVASLLKHRYVITPDWAPWLQMGLFILFLIYLSFGLPHFRLTLALTFSLNLLILTILLSFYLIQQGWIVSMTLPLALVPVGHFALDIKRGFSAYQEAFRLRPEMVANNRLLGLAFQGQGYLDLAFEKFCLCPPDAVMMGLFYNLALDYEFKHQFRQASTVYEYIVSYHPDFRDVEQRLTQLKKTGWLNNNNPLASEVHQEKLTLGRYQIERALGKGSMGTVYLGRDPKMDRFVAIKTLALAQEFDTNELPEATTRFFREASAAGRLSHPYIVSIFDAGEEHDMAYIAMEFFKGGNLVPYTRQDNLLPIITVLNIVMNVAEALNYAHSQAVIHRDIKPANIMYNPATGNIKITDFGIAHITDANKTKTGIILGTPSYMSPEQLAGKMLDGRADLFSLGVTLFQLLTGALPFHADSMATLMFKIANESHPDILVLRPDLPPCLKPVVDKALQKNPANRYERGLQFAQALCDCGYQMGETFVQTLRENSNGVGGRFICN